MVQQPLFCNIFLFPISLQHHYSDFKTADIIYDLLYGTEIQITDAVAY